jgi:hypothetical protein
MPAEFEKRRGYSLLKWLPVLTGTIITSTEASENFLWDSRKTISEMVAEYHYDNLTKILAKYGMKRYTESHESGRALIADGMEIKEKLRYQCRQCGHLICSSIKTTNQDI